MLHKKRNSLLNFRFIKFLLISPIFLSIPLLTNVYEANAGLEFQWDQDSGYKKLKWFQKEEKRRFKNTIFLFLRSSDRATELLKINLSIPKKFQSVLKTENITLCKVSIGGFEGRTKCLEDIEADIELKEDNSSLVFYPYKPIPSNKDSYAIVFKVLNPKRSGLYQFHSFGQYAGQSVSNYLGSWTIGID